MLPPLHSVSMRTMRPIDRAGDSLGTSGCPMRTTRFGLGHGLGDHQSRPVLHKDQSLQPELYRRLNGSAIPNLHLTLSECCLNATDRLEPACLLVRPFVLDEAGSFVLGEAKRSNALRSAVASTAICSGVASGQRLCARSMSGLMRLPRSRDAEGLRRR